MKIKIVFQSQDAPNGGPQQQVFIECETMDGKSINVGEWSADGEYEALIIDLAALMPDTELLAALIKRNGYAQAPVKTIRTPEHSETIIGIGKDYVANIILENDALKKLLAEN